MSLETDLDCTTSEELTCFEDIELLAEQVQGIDLDVIVDPLPCGAAYSDLVCKLNELIKKHNNLAAVASLNTNKSVLSKLNDNVQALQISVTALEAKYLTL